MKYTVFGLNSIDSDGRSPVGFIKSKEVYEVVTPYGFTLPKNVERADRESFTELKKYAHCIKKALRKDLVKAKLEDNAGGRANPIAALHIIVDFIENGVYREFEHENRKSDRGKINFTKTVKKITPTITSDDLLYSSFVVSRKKFSEQSIVALAQANIINHFMDNGGEVLFGNRIHLQTDTMQLGESLIRQLNRIRANSYNSRKQQLIRWMTDYIRGAILDKETKGEWLFSIVASTLWEEMIDACFTSQKVRDKTVYGKRQEIYRSGQLVTIGSPTQHDTIYDSANEMIIFDAKMYASKRSISSEALSKQHGYYARARRKNPCKPIFNVLILPHVDGSSDVLGFQREFSPDYDHDDPNDVVLFYEIDFFKVMDAYYRGKKIVVGFKDELYAFINSEQHQADRSASWAER